MMLLHLRLLFHLAHTLKMSGKSAMTQVLAGHNHLIPVESPVIATFLTIRPLPLLTPHQKEQVRQKAILT